MNRDKKQEWATYRRLHLNRQHKSRAKRGKVDDGGIYQFIGGTRERPWLKVLKADYHRIFREEADQVQKSPLIEQLPPGKAADLLRSRLENQIYDRLLVHQQAMSEVEARTRQSEGRTLSAREKEIFGKTLDREKVDLDQEARARTTRKRWIQSVISSISQRNESAPDRLQSIWQEIVGPEDAQQVRLNYINCQRGIAYCQSVNPSISYRLRRQQGIKESLSKALNIQIKQIVFR